MTKSKKDKFKKGDRVAVYGVNQGKDLTMARRTGTVHNCEESYVNVTPDGYSNTFTFMHEQLRKLTKPKRREWVVTGMPNGGIALASDSFIRPGETVTLREVRASK